MRRLTATVIVLVALLLATVAAAPGVSAQDTTEHPAVGAWILDGTPQDATDPLELLAIAAGGTTTIAGSDGPGYGAWVPTGERTADATFLLAVSDPECGCTVGFATVRTSIEVAEDGLSFAGTYTIEPPAGMAEATGMPVGQFGPGDVTGQRIAVEAMGEPVGPLSDFEEPPPGSPAPEGVASAVRVTLQEFAVIPETTTLPAGSITFEVENIGPADPHELVIVRTDIPAAELPTREDGGFDEDAEGVEVIGEIEEFAPGTTETGSFELPPGHYAFVCNLVEEEDGELEAHYQFGMWVDVEVS